MERLINQKDYSVGNVFCSYDPLDFGDNWYYENKVKVSFPQCSRFFIENGQHNVAKTMQSSGVLKEFVLKTAEQKGFPSVVVDIEKDERYTTKMAVISYKEKDFKKTEYWLNKTFEINPTLKAIDIFCDLLMEGVCTIPPDKKYVTKNIFKKVSSIYENNLRNFCSSDFTSITNETIRYFERILDFDAALHLAESGLIVNKKNHVFKDKIKKYKRILDRFQGARFS